MTESSPSPDASSNLLRNRRRWLMGTVAGVAALAGVGMAWRRDQAPALPSAVDAQLWQLQFATPAGDTLNMASLRGKPLLINFWATWCPPCVEELPLLSRFYQENSDKGWQVLGLAVDQLSSVNRFLAQNPVTFPVAMAGLAGIDLSRSLGNASGGLPFTVVLESDGRVAHRKIGQLTPTDLQAWTARS